MALMTLEKAWIIGTWLEAVLYGINSVLVFTCLFVLVHKKERRKINTPLVAVVTTQYLVSTADISLGLTWLIIAFINHRNFPGGPTYYHSNKPHPVNAAQMILITTNSVINDLIVVWRCYRFWGKNWKVIAIPTMLGIATLACAIGQGVLFLSVKKPYEVFNPNAVPWDSSFYGLSLATNIITALLITYRICFKIIPRGLFRTGSPMRTTSAKLLMLVAQSGIIYSVMLIITFVLYLENNIGVVIAYQQLGQLGSIMPTMIILIVELKLTSRNDNIKVLMVDIDLNYPVISGHVNRRSKHCPTRIFRSLQISASQARPGCGDNLCSAT